MVELDLTCPSGTDISPLKDRVNSYFQEISFSQSEDRYTLQVSNYADAVGVSGFCAGLVPDGKVLVVHPGWQNISLQSSFGWPNASPEERKLLEKIWDEGYHAGAAARNKF